MQLYFACKLMLQKVMPKREISGFIFFFKMCSAFNLYIKDFESAHFFFFFLTRCIFICAFTFRYKVDWQIQGKIQRLHSSSILITVYKLIDFKVWSRDHRYCWIILCWNGTVALILYPFPLCACKKLSEELLILLMHYCWTVWHLVTFIVMC